MAHAPSGFWLVESYAASSRLASRSSCSIDRQQVVGDGRDLRRLGVGVRAVDRVAVCWAASSSSARRSVERARRPRR